MTTLALKKYDQLIRMYVDNSYTTGLCTSNASS